MVTKLNNLNSNSNIQQNIQEGLPQNKLRKNSSAESISSVKDYFENMYGQKEMVKPLPTTFRKCRVERFNQTKADYNLENILSNIEANIDALNSIANGSLGSSSNKSSLSIASKPMKKDAQLAAMQHIFDACTYALNHSLITVNSTSIRKDILVKLQKTTWFNDLATSNKKIKPEMRALIKKFKDLEKRVRDDEEIPHLTKFADQVFHGENKKILKELSQAQEHMKSLKDQIKMQADALKEVPEAKKVRGALESLTLFCNLEKAEIESLGKVGESLSNLQDEVKDYTAKIDILTKQRRNLLKRQIFLKMPDGGSENIMREHEVLSSETLLHSYQWIMSTKELFQVINANLKGLEKFAKKSKQDKVMRETAKKQQLRQLDFCQAWLKSGMYSNEMNSDVLTELQAVIESAKQSKSKRVQKKAVELEQVLCKVKPPIANHYEGPALEETLKSLKTAMNTYIAAKTPNHEVMSTLEKEFGAHYIELLNNIELLDLFNQSKKDKAVNWHAVGKAENNITSSIISSLAELKKTKDMNRAAQFYYDFIQKCIQKHNFATAKAVFFAVSIFIKDNPKVDAKMNKMYNNMYPYFMRDKKLDTAAKAIIECLNSKIPFIPNPDHIAHQFEQLGIVLQFKDDEKNPGLEKLNVEQIRCIEPSVAQWFKTKALFSS